VNELADSVRAAVEAGDPERVRDLVVAASEKERREIRDVVAGMWRYGYGTPKHVARHLAWLGTATARQVASEWWGIEEDDERVRDLTYDVLAARGSEFLRTVARASIDGGVQRNVLHIRRAVHEGLLDAPPDADAYLRGLVVQVGDWMEGDSVYRAVLADATLLEEVWRIFEVDCSSELANAGVWERSGGSGSLQSTGRNRWIDGLTRLADEGLLDRQRLLDESLAALTRDFRASTVSWYAKLHEALAPTADERRARLDVYLALVASPTPSVVKEGLVGLRAVEADVPADELARAVSGPLTQKQKNLAVDALGLLERAAKRDPEARRQLLEAVAQALGHERADVQERALKLLERYPDDAPRALVLGYAEAVSPTLRARVEALTGVALEDEPTVEISTAAAPTPPSVEEPLLPVESLDELIELAASLLEGQGGGDDVERLLDGVSRLCRERPKGFERRTAGLLKQADDHDFWGSPSGVDLVGIVVRSWVTGRRPPRLERTGTLMGFLAQRAREVAARAAKRKARPLLAFPTHSGGRVDPAVLEERERGARGFRNRPDYHDEAQARVRALDPATPISYRPSIFRREHWSETSRLVDIEPTGLPAGLGSLATAVSKVGRAQTGSIWLDPPAWGSWDALGARWCLTVVPSHPEIAFAGAAQLIADTLDLAPQLHPQVVLEHALDPRVPLRGVAWFAVAGGLAAKSPDLRRVATDVVVASVEDGRFDAEGLALSLAWLLEQGIAKASRLEAPLRDAGRVSSAHAAAVVRVAEALLAGVRETPHGLQAPLEAVLEHAARTGLALERADARAALARIGGEVSRSSKLGRVSQALLDLG
jgi:Family of unknown function (DUF6493)